MYKLTRCLTFMFHLHMGVQVGLCFISVVTEYTRIDNLLVNMLYVTGESIVPSEFFPTLLALMSPSTSRFGTLGRFRSETIVSVFTDATGSVFTDATGGREVWEGICLREL